MSSMLGSSPRTGSYSSSMPIPKFQHPSHSLLEDNGFKQIKYGKYFKRCIEDRQIKGESAAATAAVYVLSVWRVWVFGVPLKGKGESAAVPVIPVLTAWDLTCVTRAWCLSRGKEEGGSEKRVTLS
eukprot:1158947-Pelagomonas_calceolata.AAC.6